MTENANIQPAGTRDQGRDLMADAIDSYVSEVVEARPYDLADRIIRTLNQRGWWFVWGADVERMIAQEHPFNAKMAERVEQVCEVVDRHTHATAQYDADWWEVNTILRGPGTHLKPCVVCGVDGDHHGVGEHFNVDHVYQVATTDDELPGMWSRSDFEGGNDD